MNIVHDKVPNVYVMDYWRSTEAEKLFGRLPDEKDAHEVILNQINSFKLAIDTPNGYKNIVVPSSGEIHKEDMLGSLSEYQVFYTRNKCQTLVIALTAKLWLLL